jgi:6-phosphogluconolactonase
MKELRVFSTSTQLAAGAAELFVHAATEAVASRGYFAVALSGGRTPEQLFRLLAEPLYSRRIEWPKCVVFWADERLVPPSSPDSNFRLADLHLLQHVPIPRHQVHRVRTEEGSDAASRYEIEIRGVFEALGETGRWPQFDLVLLGMGSDGHTASLMPDSDELSGTDAWVIEPYVPHLETFRVSLSEGAINHAREVLFLVSGAEKAQAAAQVLEGPLDRANLPAQRILPETGKLHWYLDEEAASRLQKRKAS